MCEVKGENQKLHKSGHIWNTAQRHNSVKLGAYFLKVSATATVTVKVHSSKLKEFQVNCENLRKKEFEKSPSTLPFFTIRPILGE